MRCKFEICEDCVNWEKIKNQEIPECILTYSGDKNRKCYNFKHKKNNSSR